MSIESYNEKLLKFYNQNWHHKGFDDLFGTGSNWRPPLFLPAPLQTGGVLFVGMNPSSGRLAQARSALTDLRKSPKSRLSAADAKQLALSQFEATHGSPLLFFNRRHDEGNKLFDLGKYPPAHLDLFPFRVKGRQHKTVQIFESVLQEKRSFLIDLFRDGVTAYSPSVVWIANLGAYNRFFREGDSVFGKTTGMREVHPAPQVHFGKIEIGPISAPLIVTPQLSGWPYPEYKEHALRIVPKLRKLLAGHRLLRPN